MTNSRNSLSRAGITQGYARLLDDFAFTLADSEARRMEIYQLRHRVYCQEIGYTPPGGASIGIEVDAHDLHSIHCMIKHRRTGLAAGCFRLVLPKRGSLNPTPRLPLQEYGGRSLTHETLHPDRLPLRQICEISRLATARTFRHHPVHHETISEDYVTELFTEDERHLFPLLTGALFLATHALVELAGRRHIFAMMQPKLPRLLARSGFHFQQIGEAIELHGRRNAYYIDNELAEAEMNDSLRPFYRSIKRELSPQLAGALPKPTRSPLTP